MPGVESYNHTQSSLSAYWVITHNLGREPVCDVMINVGSNLVKIIPLDVQHPTINQTIIVFNTLKTGYARLI